MTVDTFQAELDEAMRAYDKFVVCLDKTPEQCRSTLRSLLKKAITAYQGRAPGLRHGIALDTHLTVILSQTDSDRPLCSVYFNLHSPFRKATPTRQPPRPDRKGE